MPTQVEADLRKKAQEKFPGDKERQNAYIFGSLRNLGWKPKKEK